MCARWESDFGFLYSVSFSCHIVRGSVETMVVFIVSNWVVQASWGGPYGELNGCKFQLQLCTSGQALFSCYK